MVEARAAKEASCFFLFDCHYYAYDSVPFLACGPCLERVVRGVLRVRGASKHDGADTDTRLLYRGIAKRNFERSFQLADNVQVSGAHLDNGLLHIELVREIPEAEKPRKINISKTVKAA